MRLLLVAAAAFFCLSAALSASVTSPATDEAITGSTMPRTLSAFGFFDGSANKPAGHLIRYSLRNPLFSDYAEKERFIYLPGKARMRVDPSGQVDFPVGTALIKSFGYPSAAGKLDILETRVLLRRETGWLALPYVWREDGSDADLKVGGKRLAVSFDTPRGKRLEISYAVPNKNQCKQCHSRDDKLVPLGPIWQEMVFESKAERDAFEERASFPRNGLFPSAKWDDAAASLSDRAASYLYANCAHCHSRRGSASNSGLFYDEALGNYAHSGYLKRPVAAGRGSAGHEFVVDPGRPEKSILISRMKSLDPGIAMPELGRATVHEEGVELLEAWISQISARD